jgi:hypothetical protein
VLSSRLNKAYFAIRAIKPLMPSDSIKMIYYSYVHSILKYGIIFWGSVPPPPSMNIFKIQKGILRVISGSSKLDQCLDLFKRSQILTLQYQYIFSLLLFIVKNKNHFTSNKDVHDINTHYNYNLHLSSTDLSKVQKGVLFSASKIYIFSRT